MDIRSVIVRHALLLVLASAAVAGAEPGSPPPAVNYGQNLAAGGALPPAESMHNPLAGDTLAAKQGEKLFAAMNCDGCHGGGAVGWAAPSLADGRWRFGGEDGAVFHSIFYGRPHGMPAFGGLLPASTIWQLVSYVKTLPIPPEVPTTAWR